MFVVEFKLLSYVINFYKVEIMSVKSIASLTGKKYVIIHQNWIPKFGEKLNPNIIKLYEQIHGPLRHDFHGGIHFQVHIYNAVWTICDSGEGHRRPDEFNLQFKRNQEGYATRKCLGKIASVL